MAIQPDGRIVAAGFSYTRNGGNFGLVRYLAEAQPTSNISVSGRITTPDGRGLRNATVAITDSLGVRRTVTTSSFGFYTFEDVRAGDTYVIGVSSRLYRFASRNLVLTESLTNVDFVGLE